MREVGHGLRAVRLGIEDGLVESRQEIARENPFRQSFRRGNGLITVWRPLSVLPERCASRYSALEAAMPAEGSRSWAGCVVR